MFRSSWASKKTSKFMSMIQGQSYFRSYWTGNASDMYLKTFTLAHRNCYVYKIIWERGNFQFVTFIFVSIHFSGITHSLSKAPLQLFVPAVIVSSVPYWNYVISRTEMEQQSVWRFGCIWVICVADTANAMSIDSEAWMDEMIIVTERVTANMSKCILHN
jgi:hypothetical protein